DQADGRLGDFVQGPALITKECEADQQRNRGSGQLLKHGHRKRRTRATHVQDRFDLLLEYVDVVLKLPREKLADLLVDAVYVGGQRQEAKQRNQRESDRPIHALLRLAGGRSVRPLKCRERS